MITSIDRSADRRSSPSPMPRPCKLQELTKEETNPDIGLRVYVYSGGCSGFRYGMMLEDAPTPEDRVLDANGIKVYVDGQSVDLLKGAQIDYVDTLMGAGFTVNNPNAVAACGCGSSFRTADDGGAPRAAPTDLRRGATARQTDPRAAGQPAASSIPGPARPLRPATGTPDPWAAPDVTRRHGRWPTRTMPCQPIDAPSRRVPLWLAYLAVGVRRPSSLHQSLEPGSLTQS